MYDDELGFGFFEAECQACDGFGSVNDLGLCAECVPKLERDMIRQRAWDYSATAFGVSAEKYEELRAATIAKYGAALELLAPDSQPGGRMRRARSGLWAAARQ